MPDPVIHPYLGALNWILRIFIILLRWKHTERWAGHVTWFGKVRNASHASKLQNLKTACHLRYLEVDVTITWMLDYGLWGYGLDSADSGYDLVAGSCKHSSSPSNPIEDLTSWMTVSFWSVTVPRVVSYESIDTSKISQHSHCTELNNKTPSFWNSNGFELIFISS